MLTENESERYEIAFNIRKGDDINNAVHFESSNCVQETTTCMVIIRTFAQPLKLWQGEKKRTIDLFYHTASNQTVSHLRHKKTQKAAWPPRALHLAGYHMKSDNAAFRVCERQAIAALLGMCLNVCI